MKERKLPKFVVDKAIQIYAGNPMIQHQEVAQLLNISEKKLRKLRRESEFHQKVYDYYMVAFETDVVAVLKSMVREAVSGNTTAGRIVLEHSGKLQKNIKIKITSPFDQFLKMNNIEDAEVVTESLPRRIAENTPRKAHNDFIRLDNELKKKKVWNKRRKELHKWKNRAKAVGISPLPAKRPTPGQRKKWEESIVRAEGL